MSSETMEEDSIDKGSVSVDKEEGEEEAAETLEVSETQKSGYEGDSDHGEDDSDDEYSDSPPKEIILEERKPKSSLSSPRGKQTAEEKGIFSSLLNMLVTPEDSGNDKQEEGGKSSGSNDSSKSLKLDGTFESTEDSDVKVFDYFINKNKWTKLFELGKFGSTSSLLPNNYSYDIGDGDIDKVLEYVEQSKWNKILDLLKAYPEVAVLRMPSPPQQRKSDQTEHSVQEEYFILEECTTEEMKKGGVDADKEPFEKNGQDASSSSKMGNALIHEVCKKNPPTDIISQILDIDSDATKEKCHRGYLPLHYACYYRASKSVIETLLESYPEAIQYAGMDSRSLPLHLACKTNAPPEVIKTLIQAYPYALKTRDGSGKKPQEYYDESNSSNQEISKIFEEFGPSLLAVYERTQFECQKLAASSLRKVEESHKEYLLTLMDDHRSTVANLEDISHAKDKKMQVMLGLLENKEQTINEHEEIRVNLQGTLMERESKLCSIEKKLSVNEKVYSNQITRQLTTITELRGENEELKIKADTADLDRDHMARKLMLCEEELEETKLLVEDKEKIVEGLKDTLSQRHEVIAAQEKELETITNHLLAKDDEIMSTNRLVDEKQKVIGLKEATCLKIQEVVLKMEKQIKSHEAKLNEKTMLLESKSTELETKEAMCMQLQGAMSAKEAEVRAVEIQLAETEQDLLDRDKKVAEMKQLAEEKENEIGDKEMAHVKLLESVEGKQAEIERVVERVNELEQQLADRTNDLSAKEKVIEEMGALCSEERDSVAIKEAQIARIEEQTALREQDFQKMEELLSGKDVEIQELTKLCEKLQETVNSGEDEAREVRSRRVLHENAFKALAEQEKNKVKQLEIEVTSLKCQNEVLQDKWDNAESERCQATNRLKDSQQTVVGSALILSEKNQVIKEKEMQCAGLSETVRRMQDEIKSLQIRLTEQEKEIAGKESALKCKDEALHQKDSSCLKLQAAVVTLDTEMDAVVNILKQEQKCAAQISNGRCQSSEPFNGVLQLGDTDLTDDDSITKEVRDNEELHRGSVEIPDDHSMPKVIKDLEGREGISSPATVATVDTKGESWFNSRLSEDNSEVMVPGLVKRLVTRLESRKCDDEEIVSA